MILPATTVNAKHGSRFAARRPDQPGDAGDERRLSGPRAARKRPRHLFGSTDFGRQSRCTRTPLRCASGLAATAVLSARSTTFGSSTAMSAEKSPARDAAERLRRFPSGARYLVSAAADFPCTRRRARLPAAAPRPGCARQSGRCPQTAVEHIVQHERYALGRRERFQHDKHGEAEEFAISRSLPGFRRHLRFHPGARASSGSSRRDFLDARCQGRCARRRGPAIRRNCRQRSVSARLSLSQASCTASSASPREPSIR